MTRHIKGGMPYHTRFNLWTGFFVAGAILLILMILQVTYPKPLGLETRWLVAATIPILIALVVGGYISRVKGPGGIELFLAQPVSNLTLTATSSLKTPRGMQKGSLQTLFQLTPDQAATIERLVMTEGVPDFYGAHALAQYIEALPSLQYIEIQSQNGKFIALISINEVKNADFFDRDENLSRGVNRLIRAIETSSVVIEYGTSAITNTATNTSGIVEALKQMRKYSTDKLIILDSESKFKGLLLEKDLEERLVDLILQESSDSPQ